MLIGKIVIELVLVVVADSCDVEEFCVICESDPEASIILILQANLRLRTFSPFFRLVTPISLPLSLAPRIANLDEPLRLAIVERDQFRSNQAVGVCIYKSGPFDLRFAQIFVCYTGN